MQSLLQLLGLVALASAAPNNVLQERAQTVYLAGDSTMQTYNSGNIQGSTFPFPFYPINLIPTGWGYYLPYSLTIPVINRALGGRSARSFTVENRFQEIINTVKPNDIVIIEFGHNDGGSLSSTDNGRTACPGAGNETCRSTYNGQTVTVLTYPAYLINAGKALVAKGAKVIISSPTPNNPWEGGSFSYAPSRFTTYSQSAAQQIGQNAWFVDHGTYTANIFRTLGKTKVDKMFPNDHTHTGPEGADVVAKAFVKAVLCGGGGFLGGLLRNQTGGVEGSCV